MYIYAHIYIFLFFFLSFFPPLHYTFTDSYTCEFAAPMSPGTASELVNNVPAYIYIYIYVCVCVCIDSHVCEFAAPMSPGTASELVSRTASKREALIR